MIRHPRILIVAWAVTMGLGLGVLLDVQLQSASDRENARRDTCTLIVGLARAAAGTSQQALTQANAYIDRTVLRDCSLYARDPTAKPLKP